MPRIVKEYAIRRDEILDSAQKLIYSKGFEQMTIQDILADLSIAKGTFYYYFDSKQALLEALTVRSLDRMEQVVRPIVDDAHMSGLEKLQRFFATVARWETDQKEFILALLRVWYNDENTVVREKTRVMTVARVAPLLASIIRQGVEEGTFNTAHPDQAGAILLLILTGLEESVVGLIMLAEPAPGDLERVEGVLAAYADAVERVLGAPPGTFQLIDLATLKEWLNLRRPDGGD